MNKKEFWYPEPPGEKEEYANARLFLRQFNVSERSIGLYFCFIFIREIRVEKYRIETKTKEL